MKYIFKDKLETTIEHKDQTLRILTFRETYENCKYVVNKFAKEYQFDITTTDDKYGEIALESKSANIVVTLGRESGYENSISIMVCMASKLYFGKAYKIIQDFHQFLNKNLERK